MKPTFYVALDAICLASVAALAFLLGYAFMGGGVQ